MIGPAAVSWALVSCAAGPVGISTLDEADDGAAEAAALGEPGAGLLVVAPAAGEADPAGLLSAAGFPPPPPHALSVAASARTAPVLRRTRGRGRVNGGCTEGLSDWWVAPEAPRARAAPARGAGTTRRGRSYDVVRTSCGCLRAPQHPIFGPDLAKSQPIGGGRSAASARCASSATTGRPDTPPSFGCSYQ
ncbi:hypothetical protein GCM10009665_39200 [Kitasatospora nipponensis]|uniref:Secreted protein n=1 Tax=Kitasatospora nipponensis TaxID=258049 RepID=A0ABN1WBW8_9ACTN